MNLDERLEAVRREYLDRSWPAPGTLPDTHGRPPPPHRGVLVGVVAVVCVLLAVAIVLAVRSPSPDGDLVAGPSATGTMSPPGTSGGDLARGLVSAEPGPAQPELPAGWKLIDYNDFRFAVPADWQIPVSRSCGQPFGDPTPTGAVLLQTSPADSQATCGPEQPLPASVLTLVGSQPSAFSGQASTVGTFSAVRYAGPSCGSPTCPHNQYLFDNGFVLSYTGPLEEQVLATFTTSGRDRALHTGPAADRKGWKSLTVGDVIVQVPPDWTTVDLPGSYHEERRSDGALSITGMFNPGTCTGVYFQEGGTPQAYIGTSPGMPSCPATMTRDLIPADGVWIRPAGQDNPGTLAVDRSVEANGVTVTLLKTSPQLTVPVVDLEVKTRNATVLVSIGVGADPSVARSILQSLSTV